MKYDIKKRKECCRVGELAPGDMFLHSKKKYQILANANLDPCIGGDQYDTRFRIQESWGCDGYRTTGKIHVFCHDTGSLGAFEKSTGVRPIGDFGRGKVSAGTLKGGEVIEQCNAFYVVLDPSFSEHMNDMCDENCVHLMHLDNGRIRSISITDCVRKVEGKFLGRVK